MEMNFTLLPILTKAPRLEVPSGKKLLYPLLGSVIEKSLKRIDYCLLVLKDDSPNVRVTKPWSLIVTNLLKSLSFLFYS